MDNRQRVPAGTGLAEKEFQQRRKSKAHRTANIDRVELRKVIIRRVQLLPNGRATGQLPML
jgi:hypothetical protein